MKSEEDKSLTEIDEELLTMLETHNKHILKKQAKYDENGRRIHKGNPMTCPAPTKVWHFLIGSTQDWKQSLQKKFF